MVHARVPVDNTPPAIVLSSADPVDRPAGSRPPRGGMQRVPATGGFTRSCRRERAIPPVEPVVSASVQACRARHRGHRAVAEFPASLSEAEG
jgi:hypothetical protein